MSSMYSAKKKVKKPYTGPPRPTLLGQDKTIRGMTSTIEAMQSTIRQQQEEIEKINVRLRKAIGDISLLSNYLQRKK